MENSVGRLGICGVVVLVVAVGVLVGAATALADGQMEVDCDTGTPGVQADCTGADSKPSGATFDVLVHVTQAPAATYSGFQVKLAWTDANLQFNSAAGVLVLWPDCQIPAAQDNQPGDPSMRFGCVTIIPVASTFTGAVAQFEFECQVDGTTDIDLVPRVGDPQGGTFFVGPIDPALVKATVECAGPPAPEGVSPPSLPAPTSPVTQPSLVPVDASFAGMSIAGKTVRVDSKGRVPVRVSCPAAETTCTGKLTLKTKGKVKVSASRKRARKRKVTLGRKSFTIAGGKTAKVKVRLSKKNQRLLRKLRTVRVVATAVAHDQASNSQTTKKTLKLKAAKKKRKKRGR